MLFRSAAMGGVEAADESDPGGRSNYAEVALLRYLAAGHDSRDLICKSMVWTEYVRKFKKNSRLSKCCWQIQPLDVGIIKLLASKSKSVITSKKSVRLVSPDRTCWSLSRRSIKQTGHMALIISSSSSDLALFSKNFKVGVICDDSASRKIGRAHV